MSRFVALIFLFALISGCKAGPGKPCETVDDCASELLCDLPVNLQGPGVCRPCREARLCKQWGICTPVRGGRCIAGSIDDCLQSTNCQQLGACTLEGGMCVQTKIPQLR